MKLIIAGSRNFTDYPLLKKTLTPIRSLISEIVSGTARGADQLGEQFALEHDIPIKQFPADWDRYGKPAGYIRNAQMAEYADALIAFWDGKSAGTGHMIEVARKNKLMVSVISKDS